MYLPYFRGKREELLLLRAQAQLIAKSKIVPIVEPVKENTNLLNNAIFSLIQHKGKVIIVVNPY
jgi:hypothetical protein